MSAAFAWIEGTPRPKEYWHLSQAETFRMVADETDRMEVVEKLGSFNLAAENIPRLGNRQDRKYHLIHLSFPDKKLTIQSFADKHLELANETYAQIEQVIREKGTGQVVLVSTDSIKNLKAAYPNFFLDTTAFLRELQYIRNAARP